MAVAVSFTADSQAAERLAPGLFRLLQTSHGRQNLGQIVVPLSLMERYVDIHRIHARQALEGVNRFAHVPLGLLPLGRVEELNAQQVVAERKSLDVFSKILVAW